MIDEHTITVEGMTCTGCEQSVQRAVGRLDGVETASADHTAGRVTVRFDGDIVSEDDIAARIQEAGYTVPA